MGRSLFSQNYSEPAVRIEPEPKVDICERWSTWNRFDPDSEDFFQDAEYEAFIDSIQYQQTQAALRTAETSSESSESSEGSVSDIDSPMAIGSDDPAVLISRAQLNRIGQTAEPQWQGATDANVSATFTGNLPVFPSRMADGESDIPAFIPPAAFRAPTPGLEVDVDMVPPSPTLQRAVAITPIATSGLTIEAIGRSPSPESPTMPSTPPMQPIRHRNSAQTMLTPSPPPTVTPRFYSWQVHPIPAIPSSPSMIRANRDGPLTNPRARMSFARIDASPVAITAQMR